MSGKRKPYKFDVKKKEAYLQHLREGTRRGAAAQAVGVSRMTVHTAMQGEEFAQAVTQAEMEANELVEDALFQAAVSGNVVACQVWLYNRAPHRWQDRRRTEVTTPQDSPIEVVVRRVGEYYGRNLVANTSAAPSGGAA